MATTAFGSPSTAAVAHAGKPHQPLAMPTPKPDFTRAIIVRSASLFVWLVADD
jgi:hypothetical protein